MGVDPLRMVIERIIWLGGRGRDSGRRGIGEGPGTEHRRAGGDTDPEGRDKVTRG